jgi:glycerol-3-phosphate dehydrogenase
VKALPILIPIYEGNKRGPIIIRAGMISYDLLSSTKLLRRHRMLTRAEALAEAPGLNPNGLRAAAIYYDAQVEFAERLVVENVISARKHGAVVVTYAKVEKLIVADGMVQGVEVVDVFSQELFAATATIVVNASGPWVDQVLANAGNSSPRLIGGTKGSHLIVAPFCGAPRTAMYVEAESDRRPFFIIPWDGKYLIGTTDIRFEGNLDKVQIHDDEIDYLLQETNRVLPDARVTRHSVLYTYSGVRPLAYTENKDEQSITRRHFVRESRHAKGVVSIVGGKLTTYRSLAEQTVDLILSRLGRNVTESTTALAVLPGAGATNLNTLSDRIKRTYGLSTLTSERLTRVYGTRASDVMKLIGDDKMLLEVLDSETGSIAGEVIFSFKEELARTLADCLLRRTMVGLNSSLGIGADEAAAKIAQKYLGWSEDRTLRELEGYRNYVERFQPVRGKTEGPSH